jgi:two-component system, LytTR family, response regulator
MARVNVMIVDDEPPARAALRALLADHPGVEVLAEAASASEAVERIRALDPDLVFLDVEMPDGNGFSVVEEVGVERMPVTVFVTAYDQFALEAFQLHAVDYLLKPVGKERFGACMQRVCSLLQRPEPAPGGDLGGLLDAFRQQQSFPDRFVVKVGSQYVFERTEDIFWVEAEGNYVRIHLESRSYLLRRTLGEVEATLNPRSFVRVHRSTIVNAHRIRMVEPVFRGEYVVVLSNGTRVTTGRSYRARVQELLKHSG